jgi:phosphoglycerate kinase
MHLRLPQPQDVAHKTVLVRVDYNVPLKEDGSRWEVSDDRRIQASLETIGFLLNNNAKVVLISHLGRPSEAREAKFSLRPIAQHLQAKLGIPVTFVDECVGQKVQQHLAQQPDRSVTLLENLRYHPQEKKNDGEFAQQLASLAEVYINEAFSTAHRAHASTAGVAQHLPAFAGFSLAKEVQALSQVMEKPQRPFVLVVGGAKIADKVGTLQHLAHQADVTLTGGGIANTFLKAEGLEIHKSYVEDAPVDLKQKGVDYIHVAHDLLEETKTERNLVQGYLPLPKILYPIDVIAAPNQDSLDLQEIDLTHGMKDTPYDQELMYLDIGPKTIKLYTEILKTAGTIFWNGPMGVYENPHFSFGTRDIATMIADATRYFGAYSVIGGGDTIAAADHFAQSQYYSYISTAGGASLEFLAGRELPGLKPLQQK